MHKSVITLSMLALMFGCQPKTEKVVYELPKSAHLVELEHQERALKDSLEKYLALGDTIQCEHYHALYKATTDSVASLLKQETAVFMERINKVNP